MMKWPFGGMKLPYLSMYSCYAFRGGEPRLSTKGGVPCQSVAETRVGSSGCAAKRSEEIGEERRRAGGAGDGYRVDNRLEVRRHRDAVRGEDDGELLDLVARDVYHRRARSVRVRGA